MKKTMLAMALLLPLSSFSEEFIVNKYETRMIYDCTQQHPTRSGCFYLGKRILNALEWLNYEQRYRIKNDECFNTEDFKYIMSYSEPANYTYYSDRYWRDSACDLGFPMCGSRGQEPCNPIE